jgi:hypothetical protein
VPELTRARVAVVALAIVAAVSGLLLGRATAGNGPAQPSFGPARASGAPAALPQLSQAAPLPALRPRPQRPAPQKQTPVEAPPPVVRTVVTTVQAPGKKKPQRAVRIVGSG